jgi:hypothetical protein
MRVNGEVKSGIKVFYLRKAKSYIDFATRNTNNIFLKKQIYSVFCNCRFDINYVVNFNFISGGFTNFKNSTKCMNQSATTTLVDWGHWIVQVQAAKFANLSLLPNQLEAAWENSYLRKNTSFYYCI